MKFRIHSPPAVSQANLRIAPPARSDLVCREHEGIADSEAPFRTFARGRVFPGRGARRAPGLAAGFSLAFFRGGAARHHFPLVPVLVENEQDDLLHDLRTSGSMTAFFFLCLGVLAALIWFLSLISSVIGEHRPEDAANDSEECSPIDESQRQRGIIAITDAIHAYRRSRHSDERRRAKGERTNIVVLGATAIFAFLAAIAAIASALIFDRQLTEMRKAGADARIFSQAQLRAYITVTGLEIERGDPNRNIGGTLESKFWILRPEIENSGRTPTRNLRWIMGPSITSVTIDEVPGVMSQVDNDQAARGGWTYGTIGPRSRMTLEYAANFTGVAEHVFLEIAHGPFRVLYTGVIRYNDIFPNSNSNGHITKFCYLISADIVDAAKLAPGTPLELSDIGHPLGRQCPSHTNCTDEECEAADAQPKG